ncbi:hypothetical protein PBAL39_20299 [Pedobacter sp. BAL39]|uniref:RagB/SusD family nutrient uptake outer membrane protein n=1 Tax=Pedobacter sp. BAL39 TaxID=391596 RepID=UPI0001559A27|nr:RagB/SusD family nutrient uptake outer membrane protein [Pedobacter sp. BAL39]EDM36261.1 hypothetical protein PBAL39_20299 [Pedobacter sp. BAL39]
MKYPTRNYYSQLLMVLTMTLGLSLAACKKLIEIPPNPPDKISAEGVYSSDKNALGALVGLYANFNTGTYLSSINGGTLSVFTGLSADELMNTVSTPAVDETFGNSMRTDNGIAAEMWTTGYRGIYQTNAFLEGIADNPKLSESFKRQGRGEALLTRALYYFNLVNVFGKIPMVKTTDYRVNGVMPRSTVDEIYTFIISDLTESITLLTDAYPTAGRVRPNINAARALLSRVYLYKGQWKDASDMAGLVIGAGIYELVEPNGVFIDGSKEAIWQVLTLNLWGQTSEADALFPRNPSDVPQYLITEDLENALDENAAGLTDKRKLQWMGINSVAGVDYLYPAKYKNTDATVTPMEDYMIFRIGEQYLIRAEALAQQNLLDAARTDLNKIRERAGLNGTTAVTKDEVLAAIARERRVELFAEWGHRWFDLKRTGKANAVLAPLKPGWEATDALYPVPLTETKTNTFLDQNPGYN